MVTLTSGEARNRFGRLLDAAQRETVAITRYGRPAAFLISPAEMAELHDARRRSKAVADLEKWSADAGKRTNQSAAVLTGEEINRLVHDVR